MKSLLSFLPFALLAQLGLAQCVYISEYIEGSGNNKCIEIYNGTGAPIDLGAAGYAIEVYANGAVAPTNTVNLAGIIAAGGVFVVCNPLADAGFLALADQQAGGISHNGDDAVALTVGGTILDVVGQIGNDPGAEWTGGGCGTQNETLLRNPALACPSFDGSTAFDPATEWTCLPMDDLSDLGSFSTAACGLGNLTVTQTGCNVGSSSASLDFTTSGTVGTQFILTVTPDPGGLSGVYNYAALPLPLTGFTGDSLTGYDFTVSDVSGTCLDATTTDVRFDCPVADALSFTAVPASCVDVTTAWQVTVCAINSVSGKVQPDFSAPISLALAPGATGTLTGSTLLLPTNGCATFSFVYNVGETIAFTATGGGLSPGSSGPIDISSVCGELTLQRGMIDPCGDDSPNEFMSATSGGGPVVVGDVEIYSLDHLNGPQPNPNYTWSATGTSLGGSTTETCGIIGLQCNQWLDINDPIDGPIINGLINDLNLQAGCALFVAPAGPNFGTIPANSQVIFFLGAGGNPGTIPPGIPGLGTDLDFTAYCGSGPIYAVFGYHNNPTIGMGFFSNTNPRTYQIQVAGNTTASVAYPAPTAGVPGIVDGAGNYASGGDCTPPDLFGSSVLFSEAQPQTIFSDPALPNRLNMYPNPADNQLHIELPVLDTRILRIDIFSALGKSTEIRTLPHVDGNGAVELSVASLPSGWYHLKLTTEHGVFRGTFLRR